MLVVQQIRDFLLSSSPLHVSAWKENVIIPQSKAQLYHQKCFWLGFIKEDASCLYLHQMFIFLLLYSICKRGWGNHTGIIAITRTGDFWLSDLLCIMRANESSVHLGVASKNYLSSRSHIAACCLAELCVLGFNREFRIIYKHLFWIWSEDCWPAVHSLLQDTVKQFWL